MYPSGFVCYVVACHDKLFMIVICSMNNVFVKDTNIAGEMRCITLVLIPFKQLTVLQSYA